MGWEHCHIEWGEYLETYQDKAHRGYGHKLCPYSSQYRDSFKYVGTLVLGIDGSGNPITKTGEMVAGNSLDLSLYGSDYSGYQCSDHTTTEGRMVPSSNPPGFMCRDPNCFYYTTMASGTYYKEA
jgi:hypothetical protein